MQVYYNGKYLELDEVRISPFDRGFQYADGVYEVMRTYFGKLFHSSDHFARLQDSLEALKIKFDGISKLEETIYRLIEINKYQQNEVSSYIQITRGEYYPRKHSFPPENVPPTVFVSVSPIFNDTRDVSSGIKVIREKDIRWSRCDIKSISLLANILANQHAKEEGAEEAIWVRDSILYEGSHTNFWGVRDNIVWTAPLSHYILPGVSRKVLIQVCRENGVEVKEDLIRDSELDLFDEFFVTGTTTEVRPVIQIDNLRIRDGKPGKVTQKIHSLLFGYIDHMSWAKNHTKL